VEFCVDIQRIVLNEWDRGFELPDPIAMAVALDPEVATRTERRFVAVETVGEWCRGQTVVDHHEITGVGEYEPNVEVVEEASRERFLEMCCTKPYERSAGQGTQDVEHPSSRSFDVIEERRSSQNPPSTHSGE
jgi:Inosine-uridine preferring nucleoside hydrolase